ncbi:MAG: TlpA family protein disulfide reductase [Acidobacteria bacterium]|nr:TlpA family protein disulfide reductase [Acidobacteriota bacterium]
MRKLVSYVVASLMLFSSATRAVVSARQSPQSAQSSQSSQSALELFRAVDSYPQRRREELRAQGRRIDRETAEKITGEQRELAAKSAAQVASRANLSADELYYLGLLYNFADRRDDALAALRRFLAAPGAPTSGAGAQLARSLVAIYSAQKQQFDEAERARADYLAHEPRTPYKVYQMEVELGATYRRAKQLDRAAEHGREAFRLATEMKPSDLPQGAHRDQLIFNAGDSLAETYSAAKRKDDSLAALVEMQRLAFALPSVGLYESLRRKYADRLDGIERALAASASADAVSPPEIVAAEWIGDGQPVKLSDLRGRVVLIDFWYEWCLPCRAEFPAISGWQKKYRERGLVVVGLTDLQGTLHADAEKTREEKLDYLRKFVGEEKLPYANGVAERPDNLSAYGVSTFPTAVLIDRRGAVRYFSVGMSALATERLGDMIEKLLKETTPDAASH